MIITWYGEGCFKIQSGETTILTDSFLSDTGLSAPRLKANILIKTLNSFPPQEEKTENHVVSGAGEYNFGDVNILGIRSREESTDRFLKIVYLVKIEDINLLFLGHLSAAPEAEVLEYIDEVDILFIPGGGKPFMDQKAAVKTIKNLEPKIAIPSFFKIPGLKRKADDVKTFLEEFSHKTVEPQEKLTLKKKDLNQIKSPQIFVLKI